MNGKENPSYIDLTAASNAPHAEFYFRLMFAINDLSTVHTLRKILDKQHASKSINDYTYDGLDSYLMKIETGHLVEIAKAFVDKVRPSNNRPQGQHSIYTTVAQDASLLKLFNELVELVKDNAQFKELRDVRNTILFHYNDKDPQPTIEGINRAVKEFESIGRDAVEFVSYDEIQQIYRFPIGDRVMDFVWQNLNQIPTYRDPNYENAVMTVKEHRSKLAKTFVEFGESLILKWINDNHLRKPISVNTIGQSNRDPAAA